MDIQLYGSIEFQSVIIGSCFGVIEYDIDFFMQLIDKDIVIVCMADCICEFMYCLRYQVCLKAYFGVFYFFFDFIVGYECCYRVDNDNINCIGVDEVFGNFQCLFIVIRLSNKQVFCIYVQCFGVSVVKSVFCVDKCCNFVLFLIFCKCMNSQGGFIGRFWLVNFYNMFVGKFVYVECNIEV